MKKLVLILLLPFSYVMAQSDTTPSVADRWYGVERNVSLGVVSTYSGVELHLAGDTVIGEITFKKLTLTESGHGYADRCIGALRQTEDGMKVYWHDLKEEHLLYDFSAEKGDTIKDAYFNENDMREYIDHMGDEDFVGYAVEDKEVVDGRIHMTVSCCFEIGAPRYQTVWIQGVGTHNIIWPYLFGCFNSTSLWTLCAARGEETLYSFDTQHLGISNNCPDWELISDAVTDVRGNVSHAAKTVDNGNIYILRDGRQYNLLGTEVR